MTEPQAAQDRVVAPAVARIMAAVLAEFDETPGVDGPCAAAVMSGAAPNLAACEDTATTEDGVCQGLLWVRVIDDYPSTAFPAIDQTTRPDGPLGWAVVLEVGVARSAPDGLVPTGAEYVGPPMDEEQDRAEQQMLDAAIVREALLCRYVEEHDVEVLIGNNVPFGPEGGCVGSARTCTVQVL